MAYRLAVVVCEEVWPRSPGLSLAAFYHSLKAQNLSDKTKHMMSVGFSTLEGQNVFIFSSFTIDYRRNVLPSSGNFSNSLISG